MNSGAMIPCAYLRVFHPLDSFPIEERAMWERYIASGGAPPVLRPVYRDEPTEEARDVGLLASLEGECADIRRVGGGDYVCGWRTRLRSLSGWVSVSALGRPALVCA